MQRHRTPPFDQRRLAAHIRVSTFPDAQLRGISMILASNRAGRVAPEGRRRETDPKKEGPLAAALSGALSDLVTRLTSAERLAVLGALLLLPLLEAQLRGRPAAHHSESKSSDPHIQQ